MGRWKESSSSTHQMQANEKTHSAQVPPLLSCRVWVGSSSCRRCRFGSSYPLRRYPPHFNAHKVPEHYTKTTLKETRKAEAGAIDIDDIDGIDSPGVCSVFSFFWFGGDPGGLFCFSSEPDIPMYKLLSLLFLRHFGVRQPALVANLITKKYALLPTLQASCWLDSDFSSSGCLGLHVLNFQ